MTKQPFSPAAARICPARLSGTLRPPVSKSLAHRRLFALFLAAVSHADKSERVGRAREAFALAVEGLRGAGQTQSDDLLATAAALDSLWAGARRIDCRESGTTLRLLIPLAAALGAALEIDGSARLPERPLGEYETILGGHGARLDFPDFTPNRPRRYLPLRLSGRLEAGEFSLPGHISSQYLSGLLLALPLLDGDSFVRLESPLESAPYVRLTLDEMALFGVPVDFSPELGTFGGYRVKAGQKYRLPSELPELEADESQAAFFHLANFLGQNIQLQGLNPHSRQGDAIFLSLLKKLQALREGAAADGFSLDVSQIPDLVPALALACATTPGRHRLYNAGRLRLKESDRLRASAQMLETLGVAHTERETELLIDGLKQARASLPLADGGRLPLWFSGGRGQSFHDHRLMMCLCIAGSQAEGGVTLDDVDCVRKSYPDFLRDFGALGGRVCAGD